MEKCKHMRKHRCMFTILASSWLCNHSKIRPQFYRSESFAQNTNIHVSSRPVNDHNWPKKGRTFFAERTTSFLLLSQVCPPVLVLLGLQHRQYKTCFHQVQSQNDVTSLHWATGARLTKQPNTKIIRRMTIEIRTSWMFLKGFTETGGHGNACARTRSSGLKFGTSNECGIKIKEAQYFYSLPKSLKLRSMFANQKWRRLLAEDGLTKQYLEQKRSVTW